MVCVPTISFGTVCLKTVRLAVFEQGGFLLPRHNVVLLVVQASEAAVTDLPDHVRIMSRR